MTTQYLVTKTTDVPEATAASSDVVMLPISRTDGKKGKSGLCIVVPAVSEAVLSLVVTNPVGKQWITDCIDDLRSAVASKINKAGEVITSDKLGIDALLAAMKTASESQRMTKDSIGAWFDADLAPLIAARLEEKLPQVAEDKRAKMVEGYKLQFQILASREPSMPEAVKQQLLAAMELLPEDYSHVIAEKVAEKLITVQEATITLAAL